jgi:hypothetical protein
VIGRLGTAEDGGRTKDEPQEAVMIGERRADGIWFQEGRDER